MRWKSPWALCFFIAVMFLFAGLARLGIEPTATIRQETSVVDLRGFDFARGIVLVTSYTGNREFYPNQFYGPEDFSASATGKTIPPRASDAGDITAVQYGTLRLTLLLPVSVTYGMSSNTVEYSERTWVDGELLGEVGKPGRTKETTVPQIVNRTLFFTPRHEEVEIIRQYANFNHVEGGGSTRFYLGRAENVNRMNRVNAISVSIVAGCMLTIFVFYAGMFLLSNRRAYYLWFGVCCLLIGIRALNDVHFFEMLRPDLSWYAQMKARYLFSWIAIPATFVVYLRSLMPDLLHKWFMRAYCAWLTLCSAVVLCSEPLFYTSLGNVGKNGIGLFLTYVFVRLLMKLRRGRQLDEVLVCAGAAVFIFSWMGDTLYYRLAALQRHVLFLEDLSQPGMMACIYINMVALALQYSRTESELSLVRLRERELGETNAMLDRLNRMKTELMQNITHELRTPLATISVYAHLASEASRDGEPDKPDKSANADLALVSQEAERLARMADGLLQVAWTLENSVGKGPLQIGEVIAQTTRLYQVMTSKRKNRLTVDMPPEVQPLPLVLGNVDELTQVMLNLLANASRHTENGEIAVAARQKDDGYIEVSVSDTGVGIAPELLPHVFERFARGDKAGKDGKDDEKSRGLGLSICAQIVDAHGGEMRAESEAGRGTTIRFTLPVYEAIG